VSSVKAPRGWRSLHPMGTDANGGQCIASGGPRIPSIVVVMMYSRSQWAIVGWSYSLIARTSSARGGNLMRYVMPHHAARFYGLVCSRTIPVAGRESFHQVVKEQFGDWSPRQQSLTYGKYRLCLSWGQGQIAIF
jgi:hypothetical protein